MSLLDWQDQIAQLWVDDRDVCRPHSTRRERYISHFRVAQLRARRVAIVSVAITPAGDNTHRVMKLAR